MKKQFLLLLSVLLLAPAVCRAGDDVIYMHAQGQSGKAARVVHELYGSTHKIVEFGDKDRAYVPPKGTTGFGAPPSVMDGDKCVAGQASVMFIITAAGAVDSPNVTASDKRLIKSATLTVQGWEFRPARLDGKAVATVFATTLPFRCPANAQAQAK